MQNETSFENFVKTPVLCNSMCCCVQTFEPFGKALFYYPTSNFESYRTLQSYQIVTFATFYELEMHFLFNYQALIVVRLRFHLQIMIFAKLSDRSFEKKI